jgi:predicted nucleic acid-binding protein
MVNGKDTACDTCILINFALVDRFDLLTTLAEFRFCIPADVWEEIERPELRELIGQHLHSGELQLVRLDSPEELALFAVYRQVLGKGESACLAIAETRGWAIATDESKDRKWRRTIAGKTLQILNTQTLILRSIHAGRISVQEADAIKARLESNRFKFPIASFADLLS